MNLQVKIINPMLRDYGLPSYATSGSAGFDLRAIMYAPVRLLPGESKLISTGLAVYIGDPNYAAYMLPRSSMGKKGLVLGNLVGLIDSDYQGELKILAWNRNHLEALDIEPGERLAQLVIVPVVQANIQLVEDFSEVTTRGAGGWGSTGAR